MGAGDQVIEVNGEPVAFPAGMSDAQIAAAIKNMGQPTPGPLAAAPARAGAPLPAWGRVPLEAGSDIVSGAEGLLELPGMISRGATAGLNFLGDAAAAALGATPLTPQQRALRASREDNFFSDPGRWPRMATNALGITSNPRLAPQNAAERYGGAVLSAAPATALAIGTGQLETLPAIVSGATSALAGQGASDLTHDNPLAVGAASLFGGLAGLGGVKALSGDRLERIASSLGSAKTWQDAGDALQDAARTWSKGLDAKLKAIAAPLDAAVPKDAAVSLDPILGALNQITNRGGKLAGLVQTMAGRLPSKLQEILQAHKDLSTAIGGDNAAAWSDVREFRTFLGNALANPKLAGDLDDASLRQLYKVTTDTLGTTAGKYNATDLWKNFNEESTRLHSVQRDQMGKLITTENEAKESVKPEDAARRLFNSVKKGGTDAAVLRKEIPDAMDEFAAATLRQQYWDKVSPEGKAALVSDPRAQRSLLHLDAAPPSALDTFRHFGGAGLGAYLGELAGGGLAHSLDVSPEIGKVIGGFTGTAIPFAARTGLHALTNPDARAMLPFGSAIGVGVSGLQPTGPQGR